MRSTVTNANILDGITTRQAFFVLAVGNIVQTFAGSSLAGTQSISDLTPYVFTVYWNGASSNIRINGGSGETVSPGANAIVGLRIGAFISGSAQANIDLAEIIMYDTALSTANRQAVQNYLSSKYNIAVTP